MSYQVFARKWRPKQLAEMIGQEVSVRVLTSALERDQTHHALLFSGTRGVGKTTMARIFAKALNCEEGVKATPCDRCDNCLGVNQGRFIDLIEIDAASRTKVEDTRELLENLQYAPTQGRYKVYLIDEIHMLSNHSFNALLKSLEEPPGHVKFLLATTDPQKIPITIISRCLQIHLRHIAPESIAQQMQTILAAEGIEHDTVSLTLLAEAAKGSMRDGLSLLDQAICLSNPLQEAATRQMLGLLGDDLHRRITSALLAGDGKSLFQAIAEMAKTTTDFARALDELLLALQQLALMQQEKTLTRQCPEHQRWLLDLLDATDPEMLQLYYQIGIHGKKELSHAPDGLTGYKMTLLRMLAFTPEESGADSATQSKTSAASETMKAQPESGTTDQIANSVTVIDAPDSVANMPAAVSDPPARNDASSGDRISKAIGVPECWYLLVGELNLQGFANELGIHIEPVKLTDQCLTVHLEKEYVFLNAEGYRSKVMQALSEIHGSKIQLEIVVVDSCPNSAHNYFLAQQQEKKNQAIRSLEKDQNVLKMMELAEATLDRESVVPGK